MFDAIIDDLQEASRYARQQPDAARQLVLRANDRLTGIAISKTGEQIGRGIHRLTNNLSVGISHINACPDVLKGYCLGAAFELQDWAARLEKDKEARP